jgi:hypothetical protein
MIDEDNTNHKHNQHATYETAIPNHGHIVNNDEAVNHYKISHSQARLGNYEKLLTILNDCLQGKAQHLGILFGATPQMVEDTRRGLFSYDALRTRLQESRFAVRAGIRDMSGTVIKLDPLSFEEIFVLLQRLRHLHAMFHGYSEHVTDEQLKSFMEETLNRLGARRFSTPREIIRDFIAVLNLIQQNSGVGFDTLIHGEDFQPTAAGPDTDAVALENDGAASVSGSAAAPAGDEGIDDKFKSFTL